MTNFNKIDANTLEITNKQVVFMEDLLSEKETLEARLVELKSMIDSLK